MPCEHYKDALIESAASGATPPGELRAHLAECAPCRAAFAQEQALFAGIDSSLHASANAEVPTSLLPRVRAGLDEAVAPQRRWVPALGAAVTTIAVVAGFLIFRGGELGPVRHEIASNQAPHEVSPSEAATPLRENSVETPAKSIVVRRRRLKTAGPTLAVKEPMVLVPIGQERAVVRLLDGLRRGEIKGEVLVADGREHQPQDLSIAPLEVAPIEVKALESAQPESH